ncbi:MAG TPA: ADP-ribosyltransferase [Actinomadura sp.]|nr:ADP-ribosyltransferase [Actinomadura sp.]
MDSGEGVHASAPRPEQGSHDGGTGDVSNEPVRDAGAVHALNDASIESKTASWRDFVDARGTGYADRFSMEEAFNWRTKDLDLDLGRDVEAAQARFKGDAGTSGPVPEVVPDVVPEVVSAEELPPGAVEQRLPSTSRDAYVVHGQTLPDGRVVVDGEAMTAERLAAWIGDQRAFGKSAEGRPVVLVAADAETFAPVVAARLDRPVVAPWGGFVQVPSGRLMTGTAVRMQDGGLSLAGTPADTWKVYEPGGEVTPLARELGAALDLLAGRGGGLTAPAEVPAQVTMWGAGQGRPVSELGDLAEDPALQWLSIIAGAPPDTPAQESSEPGLDQTAASAQPSPAGTADTKADADLTATVSPPGSTQPAEVQPESAPAGGPAEGARPAETPEPEPEAASSGPETVRPRRPVYPVAEIDQRRPVGLEQAAPALAERTVWEDDARLPSYFFDEADPGPGHGDTRLRGHAEILAGLQSLSLPQVTWDEIRAALAEEPASFLGDGRPFTVASPGQDPYEIVIQARSRGNWDRFHDMHPESIRVDTLTAQTSGVTTEKTSGTQSHLSFALPLGPGGTRGTGFGQVNLDMVGNERAYTYGYGTVGTDQREVRVSGGSHVHVDDLTFSVRTYRTDIGVQRQMSALAQFVVQGGLEVRVPDRLTKPADTDLPRRFALNGRVPDTYHVEQVGSVAPLMDRALELFPGSAIGSPAYQALRQMLSTRGVTSAMGEMIQDWSGLQEVAGTDLERPVGALRLRARPISAELLVAADGHEMRVGRVGGTRTEVTAATTNALQVSGMAGGMGSFHGAVARGRIQAGLTGQVAWTTRESAMSGGTATRKRLAVTSGTTGLYKVEVEYGMQRTGGEEVTARGHVLLRLPESEARRLAAGQSPDQAAQPAVPPYLTADRPSTLGLHDVRSLTGLPSLQERAIAALARRYPNLVAPWIELDPAHPRWKGNQDVYILALRNTIELSRFLSATSIAPSMDTLISTGLRLRLRAYDLLRKDYVTVRLRAELRNRRFAGSESDIGMRIYSTLADRLDSARRVQYSASAGIGMGGRAQDAAAVYTGSVSASWRYTWQRSRTSAFGQALTGDDQVVAPGPSHSFAYDLDFRLEAAGFNRLRNAVRAGTLEVLAHEYFVRKTPWTPVLDDGPATGTLTVRVPDSLTKAMAEPVPAPARTDAGAGQGADTRDWRQRGHAVVGVTGTAELNKAVQGVIAESQEDSWLFTQPGSTAHEVVQDGLTADAHNANFLRMATGGWELGPVLAKRPVQDRIGTVGVTAEVGRLRAVSGLISGMELELDRQGEMRSGHGVGTAQGHGAGLSATFGAKPTIDGTPVSGGYGALWTLYERMRGQERSSSLTGVHDVDPVPSGRFVLVTGDVTYTVAAQGRRTGRAAPKFAVATRDPSTELTVPEGVYMLVPEDDARDMGLLPQAPGAEPDYGSVTVPREYLSAPLGWAPENTPDAGEAVALLRTWFEDKASGRPPSRYAGLLPAEELEDLSNNLRHLRSATSTLGMAGLLSQMVADGVPIRLLQGRAYLPWTNSARVWIRVQLGDPTFLRAHHNMEIDEYPSNAEAEQTAQSISRTRGGGISITQTPLLHDSPAHHVDAAFTDVGTLTQTDTRTEAKRSTHLRGTVASPRATAKLAFPTTVILSVEEKGKVVHSVSAPGGPLVAQVPWGFTVPTARADAEMGASLRSLQPGVGAHDRPLELPDAAAILNVGGVAAIRHIGTAAVAAVHGAPDHRVGRTPLTQGGNVAGEVLANALSQPVLRTLFPRLTRPGGLELPELSENFITGGATAQPTAHAQVDLGGGVLTSVSYDHRMDTADRQARSVAAKGTRSDGRSATVGAGPIFATTGPALEAGPAYQGGLNSTQRMWVEGDADGDSTQVDQAQRSLRKDLSTRSFVFRFPVDWRITATGTRATWSGLGAALARKGPLRPQTKELHVEKGVWIRLTEAEARANGLITDENFPPVVSAEWDAVAAASVAWKAADKTFRDTRDDVRTAHDAVEAARKNVAEAEAALAEHPDDVAALAAATGAQAALADAEPETAAPEEAMAAARTAAEKAAARFRDLHASAVAMTTWHRTLAAQRAGKEPRPLPSQEQVAQDRAAREQAAEFERWVPLPPLPTIAEEDESGGLGGSSDEGDALRDLRADAPSPEGFQVGPSQGIHPDGLTADDIAQGLYENLPIDEVHELARTAAWILRSQSDSPLGESIRAVDERGHLWRIADELHRNGQQAAELLARALTALRENRSVDAPDTKEEDGQASNPRPFVGGANPLPDIFEDLVREVAAPDESVDLGTVSARRPPKVEQAPEDPPEPQSGVFDAPPPAATEDAGGPATPHVVDADALSRDMRSALWDGDSQSSGSRQRDGQAREGEPQVSTAPRSDERPPADRPTYSTVSETARVDPDHDFGPPVAPQRARATEMDGRNVRLNPLWVPLEEMSPSLLTGDRNSVWLYTVTEDLRVLLGSEQPSAIMSEGQLTDLVAGLREKDPQLREMDLDQARRSVIQWLDGQGHLGIAARFAADGRTGPGPSRVSGEFRWNEASRSWMVDDNSGRYMSEEVRGGLDSVDAARWVGNVAKRFSEHLGMEVRPELFNIAFVRPIRDSSGRVVGHSFLDDEWHGVVESAAHLLLSGAVTHVRSDSEPEAVYPLREDPVGFFPKPWGDTPAHVIVVVGDRSGVAVRISADEEFAMDGERFVRLLLNRQEGFRQLPPDVPILMLGGEMAADPDPDEWSVKPPAGQVIANRTGRDIWASTTFLFPIRDESARTHSALALREQGGRRGELVRFRSDPGPDELHRLVAATHPGQAGTVPGGDPRRMLHLVRTARRLYPGDDAEQHLKALRALDDLRSADKTLGVLPALPFDVNVLDQIARLVYGWPGSTGVSSDGRRHLISLVETMAGTSGGSVTVKDLARAARATRTPPPIGTFVDPPRKPEADSIVVVGNDDSVSTSSSSSGSSSEVSASSAALRAIFPRALVFGREREAAGYGLLQWGQYVGGLPHDQQVSLRNHMQGPMSAPGLPYRPSFLEINAYLRQRWEATMAGLWDLDLLGFVTFRNNDDKTATVRVSRFLEQAREAVQHDIRNIDAAIGSRPVREDLVVSTTTVLDLLGSSPEEWLGTVFRVRGYLSTSLGEPATLSTPSVLHLRVPTGTRALGLAMLMPSGTGDRELLIDRDTVIRITEVTRNEDGDCHAYGEILTPDDQIPVDVVDI